MLFKHGEMMDFAGKQNHVVLATTNNVVKFNGELVMGGGAALDVATLFPEAKKQLGTVVKSLGPEYAFYWRDAHVTLPDRPYCPYGAFQTKLHYKDPSYLWLIDNAASKLKAVAETFKDVTFHLPFPGIGLGGLPKQTVQAVLDQAVLPDNVWVWTK